MLEPEIEMGAARRVLLDDEAIAFGPFAFGFGLRRLGESPAWPCSRREGPRLWPAPWL